ncbi:ABC transporter substrate-binding protein [Paenibacillus xanthanilyticus]|uniref:ABC transporter substrate-binding protein n=1 Tax=Paenibacillus xanthanilyticus TaxID=1783531 RepID=A0ABV8K8P8_9BACL
MRKPKRSVLLLTAFLVLAIVLVVGCGNSGSAEKTESSAGSGSASNTAEEKTGQPSTEENTQQEANGEKAVKVRIALNGSLNPLVIAEQKGWLKEGFDQLNAEVEWSKFASGPPILEALVSGRVDLTFLGDGATITGLSNKLPIQVVGLIGEGKNLNAILVSADSPITKVQDLKGKKVGLSRGSSSHVYLIKVLEANGLTQKDLTIINLNPEDAQAAFESGQLDAWVTVDPNITLNVATKKAKALEANTEVQAPLSMIAHTEFAQKHPELVVEYLKQFKRSLEWQTANLDEAAQIYSEQTKLPAAIVKTFLERSSSLLSAYTQEALAAQETTAGILLKNGFLKKEVAFKDGVNDSFVQQALE